MRKRKEDRIVIIDEHGIAEERWHMDIEEDIQDNGRTLKLFIKPKK